MNPAATLSTLQSRLQAVYEIELEQQAGDYLVTCATLARQLDQSRLNEHAREKLLLLEDEEGLNLSLYIDAEVFERLQGPDPFESLDPSNLEEFCLVLEGLSHFIYLGWHALRDRPVTLLEMELQAEVDKYIILLHWLESHDTRMRPGQLTRLLFESNRYHPDLGHEQTRRYFEANRYAMRYCLHLEARFGGLRDRNGLLAELRRFYRLGQQGKVRRIEQPH